MIFKQGKNTPLNQNTGTVPYVGSALLNWFQPMVFGIVEKTVSNFQAVENMVNVGFQGTWQPLSAKRLSMKPEGQQAWSWYWVHADPSLQLNNDQVITYLGKQYRVMNLKDYIIYGYMEYELVEDYTGAGPTVVEA